MRANDSFIHRIVPGEGIEDQSADTLPHGVRLALHSRGSARILGSFGRAHTLRPARDARRFRRCQTWSASRERQGSVRRDLVRMSNFLSGA
jgi:hypothetical protein